MRSFSSTIKKLWCVEAHVVMGVFSNFAANLLYRPDDTKKYKQNNIFSLFDISIM